MAYQPFFEDCMSPQGLQQQRDAKQAAIQEALETSPLPRTELVQNDTGPQLLLTLVDVNTGLPLDLSKQGTEVQFNFAIGHDTATKAVIPMFPGPDALNGEVLLDWAAGTSGAMDTIGDYFGEVQITWPNGRIQTTPTKLKFHIRGELG
jgi:hypothetical protein